VNHLTGQFGIVVGPSLAGIPLDNKVPALDITQSTKLLKERYPAIMEGSVKDHLVLEASPASAVTNAHALRGGGLGKTRPLGSDVLGG